MKNYGYCLKHLVNWNKDESEDCVLCRVSKERSEERQRRSLQSVNFLQTAYLRKIETLERKYDFPKIVDLVIKQFPTFTFKNSREEDVIRHRKVLIRLLRDKYHFSFPAIAAFFQKQGLTTYDHTTVIHHYYEKNKTRSIVRKTNNNQRTQTKETIYEI